MRRSGFWNPLRRRDQRTVLLRSTGRWFVPVPPLDRTRSTSQTARSSRAGIPRCAARAAGFRLRLDSGRCAPASFRYVLLSVLRSTGSFAPLADTQTEASQTKYTYVIFDSNKNLTRSIGPLKRPKKSWRIFSATTPSNRSIARASFLSSLRH